MKVGLYTTLLAVFVVAILSPPTNACRRDRELFDFEDNNNVEHLRKLDGHSAHGLWDVLWGKILKCVSYWKGEEEECVDTCMGGDEGTCCTMEARGEPLTQQGGQPCCGDFGNGGLECGEEQAPDDGCIEAPER